MLSNKEKIKQIMFENEGELYSVKDFKFLCNSDEALNIISELTNSGQITCVVEGIFSKLRKSLRLSLEIYPSEMDVAFKLAEINEWKILLSGESCLNLTYVSNQNPIYPVFSSTGPSKEFKYGKNKRIKFVHEELSGIFSLDPDMGLLVNAIKYLGKAGVTKQNLLNFALYSKTKNLSLTNNNINLPKWILQTVYKILKLKMEVNYDSFYSAI